MDATDTKNRSFSLRRKIYEISLREIVPPGSPGRAVNSCKENDRLPRPTSRSTSDRLGSGGTTPYRDGGGSGLL